MTEFEQNAMFTNWIREIVKYPSFLNDLQPTEYQIKKFLDFIQSNIASMEERIIDKMTFKFGVSIPGTIFFGNIPEELKPYELKELERIKDISTEYRNSIFLKCIEESISSGLIPKSTEKPVQAPEIPEIMINSDVIDILFDNLKHYFLASEHEALKDVLNGKRIESKLTFSGRQVQLSDLFKRVFMAGKIAGSNKKQVCQWLKANFKLKNKEYLSFDSMYDYFKKSNTCSKPIISSI